MEHFQHFKEADLNVGKLLSRGYELAKETNKIHELHARVTKTLVEVVQCRKDILSDLNEAFYHSKCVSDATIAQMARLAERINSLENSGSINNVVIEKLNSDYLHLSDVVARVAEMYSKTK